jgi:hypothetical protein
MHLVLDSAPLIFLGKIDQLTLLKRLFGHDIIVPRPVRDEILPPTLPPDEERRLNTFLDGCQIIDPGTVGFRAHGLSRADSAILIVAREQGADLVLSDDRLLRRVAIAEGLRTIGTLGVLIRATKHGFLSAAQTEKLLSQLVREHGFRISTAVYDAVRAAIRGSEG